MIYVLIIAALGLYAVRYAFSGVDNALVYADGKYVELPPIHDAEQNQQLASTGAHLCYLAVIWHLAGWGWVQAVGLVLSLMGAILVGDFHFNRFIISVTGKDHAVWYWPLLRINYPKWFAGRRRWLQPFVGVGFFCWGLALWAQ